MPLALFVTDLDNNLVGDDEALRELNHQLSDYRQNQGTNSPYAEGYKTLTPSPSPKGGEGKRKIQNHLLLPFSRSGRRGWGMRADFLSA